MSDVAGEDEGEATAAPAAAPAGRSGTEPADRRPTQMEPKERQYGLVLAALCFLAIAVPWLPDVVSGKSGAIWRFLLSFGMSIALALAARRGHRVIATFAAALAGIAVVPKFVPSLVVQFLCLIYAGWVMLRTNRAVRAANLARGRMTPAERAAARRDAKEAKAARRGGPEPVSPTGRKPAAASKRYTPPKKKKPQAR